MLLVAGCDCRKTQEVMKRAAKPGAKATKNIAFFPVFSNYDNFSFLFWQRKCENFGATLKIGDATCIDK